jgi:hypothetical protein
MAGRKAWPVANLLAHVNITSFSFCQALQNTIHLNRHMQKLQHSSIVAEVL